MSNPSSGIFITGQCLGYFETQNGQYVNRTLAIVTSEYQDRFGQLKQNVTEVSVPQEMIEIAADPSLKHQAIRICVGQKTRHGIIKNGPRTGQSWGITDTFLRKESVIERLNKQAPVKSAS